MIYKKLSNLLVIGILAVVITDIAGCSKAPAEQNRTPVAMESPPVSNKQPIPDAEEDTGLPDQARLTAEWGIEVLGVTLSAANYMLDFRYRIIDPEKAKPFVNCREKPVLIDQRSGAKMYVPSPPKVGPLRQKSQEPHANRTYFILFANPGRYIKGGDKVTIVIGDYRIENLIVK